MASLRRTREPLWIEEPRAARWLFGSGAAAWIWLVARLWLGWTWLESGWSKVFGGNIDWEPWEWDDMSFTGDGDVGWVRSSGDTGVGDSVAGFASGAIESAEDAQPAVAYDWYVTFLEWIRDTAHPVVGPVVAIGELVIGTLLIVGLFTGIMAFLGAVLNFSFVFAGSAGTNPAMILVSMLLILAWRNAGWIGLDRWALPALGTPWRRGRLKTQDRGDGDTDRTGAHEARDDVDVDLRDPSTRVSERERAGT